MTLLCKSLILLWILAFVPLRQAAAQEAAPFRVKRAEKAMVASVHPAASAAGVEMMRAGGNAMDAAVATGFALAVVHPQAGNLGGGGFMLVRQADGVVTFLDFREKAPAAATAGMYLDKDGKVIPDASSIGYKASAVPGSVAGLTYAQKKWGKLPLRRVMAPAIRLARQGFALNQSDVASFAGKKLSLFPESRRIFQRNGKLYHSGEIFRQPELARTLERIAANPDVFYRGLMARQFAAFMKKNGGLITAKDLADYTVVERKPVRGTYRGYEVISAPPPSSGGVALLQILNILEGFDLTKFGNRSADSIHLTTEAFRRAMFDRAELLGDPDFSDIPVAQLIDKKYADAWRETIDPNKATPSAELRRPVEALHQMDRSARLTLPRREGVNTTHYSVVDENGNAVAVTATLNDTMGSRVTIAGLGFLLNNEMDDFTTAPGVPNDYGLLQGPANAIGPGKRPLSAMTPTIVLKDGKLAMVLGSPGGPRIITTVVNILMGVVDYGLNIQEAVNAPRFHHQWMPDDLLVEKTGFSPDTLRLLRSAGHNVLIGNGSDGYRTQYWSNGECIMIDPATGERLGATDARGNGKVAGY